MALSERDIVIIGTYRWPPGEDGGKAETTFSGGLNNKVQEAHGKDNAKVTVTGKKAPEVEIKITWKTKPSAAPTEDAAREFIDAVGPYGPNSGKWADIVHPDAPWYGATSVIVLDQGKIERGEGQASLTLKGRCLKKPKPIGGDGKAKTPDNTDRNMTWQTGHPPIQKVGIGSNGNEVGGFNEPDTPPEVKP